ncbi:RNA polymerase sigma factor [Mangrovimonas sp. TPBH4]|uniref:RNA polymerase sigma factor n=1 Tax=Mangrovimonas sp. TPBH4 TaxID=1645914 RepID=UPI0006B591A8|nr:sigma-70 family RNA polymerase sigma factor [Mangrovimonas sp. TPBH4]
MSDQKIVALFKSGHREKAFKQLYKLYPKIERLILSKGGKKQDAKDVFQEALIVLYRNLQKPNFQLTSSIYTYLYAVSRYIWSDTQNNLNKLSKSDLNENLEDISNQVQEEKKYRFAERAFSELGERCQQLLLMFYHKKMSFRDIAKVMQFKSEKIAKNQKYKCLAKAKDIFQNTFQSVQS